MSAVVIRIDGAGARAGQVVLVNEATLVVQRGERIAIVGPNGAGKSSLLRLIAGVLAPSQGRIEVLGQALHAARPGKPDRQFQAQVGQVFQGLHLVQRLTALDNVLLGSLARNPSWLTWARVFPRAEVERANAALETVGLTGKASMRVDRLSGGERQKVAIARMLLQDPQLILADEPTAALDPSAATGIARLLASIATTQGITMVSVLHDPSLLPLIANRVIGMRSGRIMFDLAAAAVDDLILEDLYRDTTPRNQPQNHPERLGEIA